MESYDMHATQIIFPSECLFVRFSEQKPVNAVHV